MTDEQPTSPMDPAARVVVVGPGAMASESPADEDGEPRGSVTDLVEQPAKVMRIGTMIKQLLDEVKSAPLDEASRRRLQQIHHASIAELEDGLAPELVEELERLSLPFVEDEVPTDAELRIAQAQLEQMRRALPPGAERPGQQSDGASGPGEERPHLGSGMYL